MALEEEADVKAETVAEFALPWRDVESDLFPFFPTFPLDTPKGTEADVTKPEAEEADESKRSSVNTAGLEPWAEEEEEDVEEEKGKLESPGTSTSALENVREIPAKGCKRETGVGEKVEKVLAEEK